MSVVANIAVNLDATRALAGLKGLDNAAKGLGSTVSRVGQAMSGFGGIVAGIGASAAVGGFVKAGIEADRTDKTIKALAGQYKETEGVTKLAADAAKQYGLGQTTAAKSVADLYGRLRPMGVSLDNIGKTFTGVNNAAASMNLSAADTEGVMLQLSQAMGSGALQGDELRSIMERLPAVGQAVAKVMGVTVGEVKKLGSDGKITTDVIIKAMDELNKIKPPPPDAYKVFQAAIQDLSTAIGTQLLPIFTPLVQKLSEIILKFKELGIGETVAQALKPIGDALLLLLNAFAALPSPIQQLIITFGAVALALSLVAVPLGAVISAFGTIITAVGGVIAAIKGMTILATLAGWLGALMPVIKVIVALFAGPVGWVAAIIAAGAAIYAFRDQIAGAFRAIIDIVRFAAQGWYEVLIKPVTDWMQGLYENIVTVAKKIAEAFAAPFEAAANFIRGVINGIINGVENAINGAIGGINNLVSGANRALSALKLPTIPTIPQVSLPRFAEGGVVSKPTLAMVGEGGEPEYIVPQSKAANFARNYIAGNRGTKAIDGSTSTPAINIQTGPVMQQGGQNYVTMQDFERGLQGLANQLLNSNRTNGGRRYAGVR